MDFKFCFLFLVQSMLVTKRYHAARFDLVVSTGNREFSCSWLGFICVSTANKEFSCC